MGEGRQEYAASDALGAASAEMAAAAVRSAAAGAAELAAAAAVGGMAQTPAKPGPGYPAAKAIRAATSRQRKPATPAVGQARPPAGQADDLGHRPSLRGPMRRDRSIVCGSMATSRVTAGVDAE
jgi:hypothetical protein